MRRPLDKRRDMGATGGLTSRRRKDWLARWMVTAGGLAVLLAMAGMLVFIVAQVAPLWRPPRAAHAGAMVPEPAQVPAARPLAVVVDEYQEYAVMVYADGRATAVRLADGTAAGSWAVAPPGVLITAVDVHPERDLLTVSLADGRLVPVQVGFTVTYPDGRRHIVPAVQMLEPISLTEDAAPLVSAVYRPWADGWIAAGVTAGSTGLTADSSGLIVRSIGLTADLGTGSTVDATAVGGTGNGGVGGGGAGAGPRVLLKVQERRRSLLGPTQVRETVIDLTDGLEGRLPTAITVQPDGRYLLVGDADGGITVWFLRDRARPERVGRVTAGEAPVTHLAFLMGGRSLVVTTADGRVSRWLPGAEPTVPGGRQFVRANEFASHSAPVVAVGVSRRTKGFVTIDAAGGWALHHATTGRTQLTGQADARGVAAGALAPRGDGVILVGPDGRLDRWAIENPHPEVSWGTLFGKVWYEGYDEPAYVWQSSGGSDAFEPKLSLVPLVFGTIKGTVYALLFAVPVAILGAVYTAHFMEPRWRAVVKPVVELMAGLPSVVLGMLAGLWLAPWLERHLPGVLVMVVLVPAAVLAVAIGWARLPAARRSRLPAGRVLLAAVPLLALAAWASLALGPVVEQWLMGGDFRRWLIEMAGLRFDQRNALVVAFAMGFAVIPIIFSISEDALASVPRHLVAGSLALGATQWETVRRVVLPVAGPAIFSAAMVGFGRAVGETMIVLMATGNTPVMDFGIFTGFRALAANVAVEMPEAPVGGTLYRVLFLSALMLVGISFLVNTLAELIRLRLRRRYAQL